MEQQNKESKQLGLKKKKEIWPLWSGKNETEMGAKEKRNFLWNYFRRGRGDSVLP